MKNADGSPGKDATRKTRSGAWWRWPVAFVLGLLLLMICPIAWLSRRITNANLIVLELLADWIEELTSN